MNTPLKCDCLNDCGDDPRIKKGLVAPCKRYVEAEKIACSSCGLTVEQSQHLAARSNTPDSAARGAMTVIDKDNLRNILDDIRKQNCPAMDDARITIEGWLLSDLIVVQSDATAQPIDLTGERIAIQKIRELCKASVMVTTYDVEQILDALANTAQGKPRNFCADCGKRTPEGSIHTCAPAYAVEQEDHIVDANKMVPSDEQIKELRNVHMDDDGNLDCIAFARAVLTTANAGKETK